MSSTKDITGDASKFLFDLPKDESKAMDMRTRINSAQAMKTVFYYGVLSENLKCESAQQIKDLLERLFISNKGEGRKESMQTLMQNLPKRIEIPLGTDDE